MSSGEDQIPGAQTYLVGGAVRDALLGLPVRERDFVVVGGSVEAMLARGFVQVGKDFPVFLHPETKEEYALARTERKSAPGYRGFVVHADPQVTLDEDLARRDLTINALAQDTDGQLIDPFGGRADLDARVLRHVSPAFVEDPVRILRVARFAARLDPLGFRVAPETAALMREMVAAGEVDALVTDRVWAELCRALGEERPARFFEELRACGALKVLLPELDRLWGVPQPPQWHPEIDTGVHVMMVLDQAARLSSEPEVRFAALCHDLGKGTTPTDILPSHHGHEERSVELLKQVCQRLPVPNRFAELAQLVARYHGKVHKIDELRASTILGVFEGADLFRRPQRFEQFLLACEADSRGRLGFEDRHYTQGETWCRLAQACLAVDTGAIARASEPARIRESIRLARLEAIKTALRIG
ncbi:MULTISPECIES: multifunctional CCA addition/repair protein [Thiorhodovibrio]|uniref:multifunctional CCA addition/repair protein n=1 Tax=Thiorhodovibrio TaxID=61593 RepID=UPI0019129272|nr:MULTISPECIES: multifunctional CCA addition/repair protein [Thiorhodovibrio]MBK5970487.1 multifunctional CCA tRNA nucleotidyl transferase/2'3'-cyclic phosphodiesterase/2'nucleotidase/phosphatase [Thiorhodovibrio winogradskyi]WPL11488.1 Multifunctional CCA protein [Thiorhodovibrio litoralis]